jgi:RNA polymerase sigma-70 factor, ECF subfamily
VSAESLPAAQNVFPDSASADEARLLQAVANGDEHAFKRLYLIYHRRLGGFLLRLTHRLDLAEELINDVMFVVWRRAGSFRGDSQVSTWIMGIAYRQGLKAIRRRRGILPLFNPQGGDQPSQAVDRDWVEQQETQQWLESALDKLPPKQRMVIELAYFKDLSCDEISRVADCPVGTVKTRMHAARRRLRGLLEDLSGSISGSARPGDTE